jgi:predicted nucleic acid-binding protein
MAKRGRKLYYWDTSAFIAWINGGQGHPPEVINGLDEIAKEVAENRAALCTSVNTKTEILQGKLTPDQKTRLDNLFKRRNVTLINVDSRIADMASEIRNYYNNRGIKISTPDAQHLATAIIYNVDEFHTLDGGDLLRLNGDVAGHPLHIRVPVAIQPSLFSGVSPIELNPTPTGGKIAKETTESESSTSQIQGGSARSVDGQTTEEKTEGQNKGGSLRPE